MDTSRNQPKEAKMRTTKNLEEPSTLGKQKPLIKLRNTAQDSTILFVILSPDHETGS